MWTTRMLKQICQYSRSGGSLWKTIIFCVLLLLLLVVRSGDAISCYTCSSRNMSDPNCHDPYNPAKSSYTRDCMVPKEGHIGQFPASFCLKIIGTKEATGESLVIRECILENMDNQCGVFRFVDDYYQGCILTCDYNGCNEAEMTRSSVKVFFITMSVMLAVTILVTL